MSTPRFTPLASLAAACLCTLLACAADDGGDTGSSTSTAAANSETSAATGSTAPDDESTSAATTAEATTAEATTAAATSDAPTTTAGESSSTSTGPAPTDGPGVLPGETGLEAFCRRYVECGGTYYMDAQACIDASLGYWGECATRRAAQDAFGACMSEIACSDWSPDAYNPASTPCAREYGDLGASEPCN